MDYRLLTKNGISQVTTSMGSFLQITPTILTDLSQLAMRDISHLLRTSHLEKLAAILHDKEASQNDRFVALELLKNACIAAGFILPSCQDTGTAIVLGKKGQLVYTGDDDESRIAAGIARTYATGNLRYSQMAALSMYEEINTGTNLPAQIDIMATHGSEYHLLYMAKGGGSANKTYLFQETRALLSPQKLMAFLEKKIRDLGTSACPPYHLAVVIGGLSADMTLKTAKLASAHALDALPGEGDKLGRHFRDHQLEAEVLAMTRTLGIGAQFGGKYFCHDVRVIRLPRHGASCPVAIAVSCSADRQAWAKITSEGVFLEQLEENPARFLPDPNNLKDESINIDLNAGINSVRTELTRHPVATRLMLTGTLIVARDIAHAKMQALLDAGKELPAYMRDFPIYYAGPAKTPQGYASGSFGPTTAGRMDSYVDALQSQGASLVMLAKGNRSAQVTAACKRYGGFYLGSIGGPAARLAQDCIKKVELLDYPELGMEAVWKIDVKDFPAFIIIDDKGNDFFAH